MNENEVNVYEYAAELLRNKEYVTLKKVISELNPADIAVILEQLTLNELVIVFRLLPKDLAADTFVEMESDHQEALIHSFSDAELKEVLDELYLDDTVDIIEEMPANMVKKILRNTDSTTRRNINELLKYPEDSAGSIMTIEFVSLRKNMTVSEALTRIRRTGVDKETIYTCYVTEKNNKLIGLVTAKTLLLANEDDIIGDIMETNVIYVNTHMDKEDVAVMFDKYHFLAMPVTDDEERLVGIVTVDDAIGVMTDEATEDIEKMAAITPGEKPYLRNGVFETYFSRVPWLLILMISAAFTGGIISSYESALSTCVVLTAYIPMIMSTGGNSGSQSSVSVIRALSLNDISMGDIFKVLWKELRVSILCGLTLAVANFIKMMIFDRGTIINSISGGTGWISALPPVYASVLVSVVVCITIAITVFCAKLVGCSLPILAKRLGFDPAVMANPFITTIVDALSLVVYFTVATNILHLV